jgi:hypothetical protein
VDFFYRKGADGAPYLFFVAASDPLPTSKYGYTKPGFFADAALGTKLSDKAAGSSGDSAHEKLKLETGETTVYMSDDAGQTYRLRIVVDADPTEIRVYAAKKVH